jgi:hypothetical protein
MQDGPNTPRLIFVTFLVLVLVLLGIAYLASRDGGDEPARATPTERGGGSSAPTYTPSSAATSAPTPSIGRRDRPAAIGDTVAFVLEEKRFVVTLVEVITGEEAAARIAKANQFNDPPPEDHEFLLFYARVKLESLPHNTRASVSEFDFSLVDASGRVWNPPSIVDPEPELQGSGFGGAVIEGWGTHVRRVGEPVHLVFEMSWDGTEGLWFAIPE